MDTFVKILHSIDRWVILVLIVMVLYRSWKGWSSKSVFTPADNRMSLFLMISADIQLLLGLYLYFVSDSGKWYTQFGGEMKAVMKNSILRFWTIEHLTGMLIAIVLIHIGRSMSKKGEDGARHKKLFIYTLIALLIILFTIPWPFRIDGISRPWINFG